jgi:hypothetical protein
MAWLDVAGGMRQPSQNALSYFPRTMLSMGTSRPERDAATGQPGHVGDTEIRTSPEPLPIHFLTFIKNSPRPALTCPDPP